MQEVSKSLQSYWLVLEILASAVLGWAIYGLGTWSDMPQELIARSPDAAFHIRQLTSITLISLGMLEGLGLAAILLTVNAFRSIRRGSRLPAELALPIALVVIPGVALMGVAAAGGLP